MTKLIAVSATVANQLHHEGHWPPNDLNKVMGADYHYDIYGITNFLNAVRWNLQHGTPPYTFTPPNGFSNAALGMNVAALIGAIDANTV